MCFSVSVSVAYVLKLPKRFSRMNRLLNAYATRLVRQIFSFLALLIHTFKKGMELCLDASRKLAEIMRLCLKEADSLSNE